MNRPDAFAGLWNVAASYAMAEGLRLGWPPLHAAGQWDVVISNLSLDAAAELQQHPAVAQVKVVEKARCINLRFADAALYAALGQGGGLPAFVRLQDAEAAELTYAYYRAVSVSQQPDAPQDVVKARELAVALLVCAVMMQASSAPQKTLMELVARYQHWHDALLRLRAAQSRAANGEFMQKEAIQYPVASALLARAAASMLRSGCEICGIEPAKEWVV